MLFVQIFAHYSSENMPPLWTQQVESLLMFSTGPTDPLTPKAALASVTQSAQKIQDVLNQFVADDACMLAFVSQFILGVAGVLI